MSTSAEEQSLLPANPPAEQQAEQELEQKRPPAIVEAGSVLLQQFVFLILDTWLILKMILVANCFAKLEICSSLSSFDV